MFFSTIARLQRDFRKKIKAVEEQLGQCKKDLQNESKKLPKVPQYEPVTPIPTNQAKADPPEALSRSKSEYHRPDKLNFPFPLMLLKVFSTRNNYFSVKQVFCPRD